MSVLVDNPFVGTWKLSIQQTSGESTGYSLVISC